MPKRRISSQNNIPDDIRIKIEKDCEEEESLVVQKFQLTSSFDETNKVKKESEINYELIVEDNIEQIQEDSPTSDDEVESSSGNGEDSNPKFIQKSLQNEVQVKLEPEEYCETEDNTLVNQHNQNHQDNETNNPEDEFMITKEEIEDFGVDLVKIEVKITKVDIEIAEPYAKKLKLDQERLTSGRKSTSKVSENVRKTRRSVENDGNNELENAKSSSKLQKSKALSKNLSHKNEDNSVNSDESSGGHFEDINDDQTTKNQDSNSNSSQSVNKIDKTSKSQTKLKKIKPTSDQKGSKTSNSLSRSTSKSKDELFKNSKHSSTTKTTLTEDNKQQKDGKYYKIFDQCKTKNQKSAEQTTSRQDSKDKPKVSSKGLESESTLPKPTRKSRSSLTKPSNSSNLNPEDTKANSSSCKSSNQKSDNNQSNSFELYSRISIEDTKDPRLFKVKKEPGSKNLNLTSKSSKTDIENPEIMKLHQMHLDALGFGTESSADISSSTLNPSTSKMPSISTPKKEFQCKLCPKSFDKRVGLINHQVAHTSSDYPCLKCGLKFKSSRAFKNHECPICSYCGKKFKNKPKLMRHVTYVHSKFSNLELFTCDLCGKALKYKISIERHMIEHLEVTKNLRFKCEICNKSFKKRMGLQNHQILHVFATLKCKKCGMTFKKQKPFDHHKCLTCTHCPKNFSSKTKLNDHIRNIHTDESQLNLFICDFCGKSFKYRPSIVRHVLDHREEATYKCEVCGKKWKSDIALRDHIRMCHAAELTTCKICLKQMKPQCIYQHMRYVHSTVRDFNCKICDAAFKTKEKLKRHLDTHNRKFNCTQCDRKFSSQYELTEHLKWHEDPDIFKCSICKKSFSTRTSLTTHTKLHKGVVRNLKCPHCPFTTHRKESIKYHLTTHEKRDKKLEMKKNWLKCEKCGALLKNKASLWGHHRKVHPIERYTCDFCGIIVKTKHSLKNHIDVKHMGQ